MFSISETIFKKIRVCFFSLIFILTFTSGSHSGDTAVIIADSLRVRNGPGTEYDAVASLAKGDKVTVTDRMEGWLEIDMGNGKGYISSNERYVAIIKTKAEDEPVKVPETEITKKALSAQAEDIDRTIENRKREIERFENAESDVIRELNGIDRSIDGITTKIRDLKKELAEVNQKIGRLEGSISDLTKIIEKDKTYVNQRLAAYYKFGNLGMAEILLSSESFFEFIHRKDLLERILQFDDERLKSLSDNLALLNEQMSALSRSKNNKLSIENKYQQHIKALADERNKREIILSDIKEVKSIQERAVASLIKTRKELDKMIADIDAEEEAAKKEQEHEHHVFSDFKGLLKLPVNGKIISYYGPVKRDDLNMTAFNSGIDIAAGRGEPIRAVMDGVVKYSGWLKGYGNIIIIDHGAHYHSVYAHAEEIFKTKGQWVEKDEVIAIVGDGGSLTGPELYFEIRHYGKSIDPLLWISENDKEQS